MKASTKKKIIRVLHKLSKYTNLEKGYLLYLGVLCFFVVVTPLIAISVSGSSDTSLIFLFHPTLLKSAAIVFLSLWVLVAWNFSVQARTFMTLLFGFKENEFLLNFWLLWLVTTAYITVGDATQLVRTETTSISLTWGYYFVHFLLLVWLVYTLVMTLQDAKKLKKTHVVTISKEADELDEKTLEGLFGKGKE